MGPRHPLLWLSTTRLVARRTVRWCPLRFGWLASSSRHQRLSECLGTPWLCHPPLCEEIPVFVFFGGVVLVCLSVDSTFHPSIHGQQVIAADSRHPYSVQSTYRPRLSLRRPHSLWLLFPVVDSPHQRSHRIRSLFASALIPAAVYSKRITTFGSTLHLTFFFSASLFTSAT